MSSQEEIQPKFDAAKRENEKRGKLSNNADKIALYLEVRESPQGGVVTDTGKGTGVISFRVCALRRDQPRKHLTSLICVVFR